MARQTYKLLKDAKGKTHLVESAKADAWLRKHGPAKSTKKSYLPSTKVERGSWVWDGERVVARSEYRGRTKGNGLQIIKDIEPFINVAVDRKVVSGRRQRRDMMRAHDLVEVGNDKRPHRMEITETRREEQGRVDDIKQAMRHHGIDIL